MKTEGKANVGNHRVVSHDEWLTARSEFLAKEKAFTQARDELNAARRALPWERVTENYEFDGPAGVESLSQLFAERSQLIVYHAMFDPQRASPSTSWTKDAACHGCSFWADNFNGIIAHLNARDVTLIAASRAPLGSIEAYRKRMGWSFKWVSSARSRFNFDFGVSFSEEQLSSKKAFYNFTMQDPRLSEREGISVFFKASSGEMFHTYSTYARGLDMFNTAYHYLDIVPKGRDEGGRGAYWVKRHDEYAAQRPCCES